MHSNNAERRGSAPRSVRFVDTLFAGATKSKPDRSNSTRQSEDLISYSLPAPEVSELMDH
jgi:hypothetical protein